MDFWAKSALSDHAPALLCLNLRREHLRGTRDPNSFAALARLAALIAEARASGVPVLHAYTRRPRIVGVACGALKGLEPRADEPVFALDNDNLFSAPSALGAARACHPHPLRIVGALWSRAGLASAQAALQRGVFAAPIRDACFESGFEPRNAAAVLAVFSEIERAAEMGRTHTNSGENVVCLNTWRS